jgi:Ribonuclease G/E
MLRLGLKEFAQRISGNSTTLFHPLKESLSQKVSQTTVNNSITFRQAVLNETSPTASLCQEATVLTESKVCTISMTACCCSNKAFKNVFVIRRRRKEK